MNLDSFTRTGWVGACAIFLLLACSSTGGENSTGSGGSGSGGSGSGGSAGGPPTPLPWSGDLEFVFVSRAIPKDGTPYYAAANGMPGQGPFSRFQAAVPGKLQVREKDGNIRTLVDGSAPSAASLNLVDVNAPEVSYDGKRIVFAGLPAGNYGANQPRQEPGAWRIYAIGVDGTGLVELTHSDRNISFEQFGGASGTGSVAGYDDTDPVWLPDGRIAFSSTRWPSIAEYQDVQTTNIYVMNADGSGMHRITAERSGADRPLVDPATGKIVFFRWWRNMRNAHDGMETVKDPNYPNEGYAVKDGLVAEDKGDQYGKVYGTERNSWQIVAVNPDGTGLEQWGGVSGHAAAAFDNQAYGGALTDDGSKLFTTFQPLHHMADQSGLGGIRMFERGPKGFSPIIGVADSNGPLLVEDPPSYNVFKPPYAAEPETLPDGRVVLSWCKDTDQDYGLYIMDADGKNLELIYDNPGTTELRARLIRPRAVPFVIADQVKDVASALPPTAAGPYDIDGTFQFDALNVYFNAPVDVDIVSAPPVGSAGTIRAFIDHERGSLSSANWKDWPILLEEKAVAADGSVLLVAPANVPLFEQLRTPMAQGYEVPLSPGNYSPPYDPPPAAHVAGHNWGRPGADARCVGCHAGHTMIPVPENALLAQWTNLAPGAVPSASSGDARGLVDRRVRTGRGDGRYWFASPNDHGKAWVELTFPVPIHVRTVRPYDMPNDIAASGVLGATVVLFSEPGKEVARGKTERLSASGTDIAFDDVRARVVRIELDTVKGARAALSEVEVIAKGAEP